MLISKDFLQIGDHESKNDEKILSSEKASNFFFPVGAILNFNWTRVAVDKYDCVRCTTLLEFPHLTLSFCPVLLHAVPTPASLVLFLKPTVCSSVAYGH